MSALRSRWGPRVRGDDRRADCPTGKSPNCCPAPFAKIFLFRLTPNQIYMHRRPTPLEGRIAIVTDAGWDAVDAAASGAQRESQGEMNLVSDKTARGRLMLFADGKAVWSWHPLLVLNLRRLSRPDRVWQNRKSADDGDKTNSLTGESTK